VEEVNFSLFLFSGGQSYTYEGGRLRPGEVHWVNIKELRDRRIPDQMGRLLPRGVSAGQAKLVVHGIAGIEESQRIIGEAILVDEGRGIRATMACPNCVSAPLRVEPGVVSVSGVVGERRSVTARVYYADGSSWAINDARAIDWLESNVSVAEVVVLHDSVRNVDRFEAALRSPGTATIDAQVNHCWICNPCIDVTLALTQQIQVRVSLPRLRARVVNPPVSGDGDAVIAGQTFTFRVEAFDPNTGQVVTSFRNPVTVNFPLKPLLLGESLSSNPVMLSSGVGTTQVVLRAVDGDNCCRQYVLTASGADSATGFIRVWFSVFSTREGLVGGTTACGRVIQPNDRFVALPARGLCHVGVILRNPVTGRIVTTTVQDVGPWCPHSTPTPGNPCVCNEDRYWNSSGVPLVESLSCDTNNSGIDLADGTHADLGSPPVNQRILWRFR